MPLLSQRIEAGVLDGGINVDDERLHSTSSPPTAPSTPRQDRLQRPVQPQVLVSVSSLNLPYQVFRLPIQPLQPPHIALTATNHRGHMRLGVRQHLIPHLRTDPNLLLGRAGP